MIVIVVRQSGVVALYKGRGSQEFNGFIRSYVAHVSTDIWQSCPVRMLSEDSENM